MLTSKIRIALGLVSVVLSFSACATPASASVNATASGQGYTATVAVTGTVPGYTDRGLARMVSPCVVSTVPSRIIGMRVDPGWQIRVHFKNIQTPRANTIVTAELLDEGRVDAVRWNQTRDLASTPSAEACQIVSRLTHQLWEVVTRAP